MTNPVAEPAVPSNFVQWRIADGRMLPHEHDYYAQRRALLAHVPRETLVDQWPVYCSRQWISWYMARYELFKMALHVKGDLVECGVGWGGGTMLWATLSSIFMPYSHNTTIWGFDSFGAHEGFVAVAPEDGTAVAEYAFTHDLPHLQAAVACHDLNRAVPHIPKVRFVPGDACESIPQMVADNPHLLIRLLSLDFDVYLPTKVALEHLVPRMPRGGLLVFDQMGNRLWPGEGQAVMEALRFHNLEIQCFPWEPAVSWAVVP